jgi:FtsH-binding integral membrane protein
VAAVVVAATVAVAVAAVVKAAVATAVVVVGVKAAAVATNTDLRSHTKGPAGPFFMVTVSAPFEP